MRFSPNHRRHLLLSLLLLLVLGCFGPCSFAADSLRSGESISGDTTLVSSGGLFEFGLFAPENATDSRYYVGIWYYNITPRVVVWVGNRDSPFTGTNSSSTTIKLDGSGNLTVLEEGWRAVWASNKTQWGANATATIQDDGDLVVKPAGGSGSTTPLWRSFDEPTDVLLSGMRITLDRSTGASTKFTSWKTPTDPSSGNFTLGIDPRGTRQLVMLGGSGEIRWRSGVWDDSIDGFTGISRMRPLAEYGFQLLPDTENPLLLVFRFTYFNQTPMRFVLLPNGTETTYIYEKERGQWRNIWQQPVTECELYNFCGSNAICMDGPTTECQCLAGFASSGNGSVRGCSRSVKLRGDGTDGFREMAAVKLPDMGEVRLGAASKEACKGLCLGNVTCTAYAYLDGEGCLTWSGDLVDMLNFTDGSNGAVLYLRVDPSLVVVPEDNGDSNNGGGHKVNIAAIVVPVAVGTILIGISIFLWWKYRSTIKETWKQGRGRRSESAVTDGGTSGEQHEYPSMLELADDVHSERKPFELPMFSFEIIEAATENFSEANELGKGGFGRVYKATLPGGENVAVKRLSKDSGQGQEEFKNEMILIAKLQHNNLVRLLGCCIQGDEKILIYEYMSNKSLDDFIFNPVKQPLLDWRKRFSIIEGVARGLLYLHRDSRLRIVHRDLKASNILLDDELNPKISDFGMARIFGYNQNSDSTTRVVGTYGYMSPEYAMEGLFSARSDVYSFGVLILEIINGHKNTKFRSDDYANLLGYAWQLWEDNRAMELVDPSIRNSCSEGQVLRCIHIALLCVQDRANDRPAMWPVVVMLGSETPIQDKPRRPTFASASSAGETMTRYNDHGFSTNDVTITDLKAR